MGDYKLPTYGECLEACGGSYKDFDKVMNVMKERWGIIIETQLFGKEILPLDSDPTMEDTDGDGLLDGMPQTYKFDDDLKRQTAPSDPEPLKYTGPKNLWKTHISQLENGENISYDYSDDYYKPPKFEWSIEFKGIIPIIDNNSAEILISLVSSFGSLGLDFRYDEEHIALHSDTTQWQSVGGYNDFYDWIFDKATSMDKMKLKFDYDGYNYVIWAWKGNYLNLGAGSEVGFYMQDETLKDLKDFTGLEQWMVDNTLPMNLSLYKDGGTSYENYYHWLPYMEQWWITGFVPDEYNWWFAPDTENTITKDQLIQIASVDLSNFGVQKDASGKTAYEKFKESLEEEDINKVICDDNTRTVWLVW